MGNKALERSWAIMAAVVNLHSGILAAYDVRDDTQPTLVAKADREVGVRDSNGDILSKMKLAIECCRKLKTSESIEDGDCVEIVQAYDGSGVFVIWTEYIRPDTNDARVVE